MAILVIWAGPDTDGITAEAKNRLIAGIRAGGGEARELHLNKKKLLSCAACGKGGYGLCRTEGRCALKDDFQEIYDALAGAEALAFVTPVYWHDLTENFKVLLDRLRRCETEHNGFLRGKRYIAVACAGGYGTGTAECLMHLETTLGHMGLKALDRLPVVRFSKEYMLPALEGAGKAFIEHYADFAFEDFHFAEP